MYYGHENDIMVYAGGKLIGTYPAESKQSTDIKNIILSVLGMCPPFSATVDAEPPGGILKIKFFNEFDTRKISPEKMREIISKMNESNLYRVLEEYISGRTLCVSYVKKFDN